MAGCGDDSSEPIPDDATRVMVGPDGAVVNSPDGVLTVTIPAGALERTTEVIIFAADVPPASLTTEYRVRPDIDLAQPAVVTYRYTLPAAMAPAEIGLGRAAVAAVDADDFAAGEGHWIPFIVASVDPVTGAVAAFDPKLSMYYSTVESPDGGTTTGSTGGTGDSSAGTTSATTTTTATSTTTMGSTGTTTATTGGPGCGDGTHEPGEVCYVAGPLLAVGMNPRDIAIGDFNGDMVLDLVTANADTDDVTVRAGDGVGGYMAAASFPTGTAPSDVAIGEFTGDADPDLVVTNEMDGTVSLLAGDVMATFATEVPFAVGNLPQAVAVGTYDAGAQADIVVANQATGDVSILLGDGVGFGMATQIPAAAGPLDVVAGEYNNDTSLDAIVATSPSLTGLAGDGAGGFFATVPYPAGTASEALASGDLNNDTNADIVVVDSATDTVGFMAGLGNGQLMPAVTIPAGTDPVAVAVADVSNDGLTDAVVVLSGDDTVSVFIGVGGGALMLSETLAVGGTPSGVALDDLNGDGVADIAVTNAGDDTVTVWLSDP